MAFVLKQSDTYVWPVTVEIPIDGGRFDRQTFDAEFKRLPQARNNEIIAAARAETTTDLEVADEVLAGWKGITDDAGKDVPYSATAKAQLLDVPGVSAAVVEGYINSLLGAKRKKLIEAAEHWARGGQQDETEDDAAVLGVSLPGPIAAADEFDVWEENWPVVELFLRVQTQWRTGMNGPVGLDYGAVAWVLRLFAEEASHRALLEDLQIMEGAVLAYIAKQGD